jgi:hypothetical protein
MVKSRIESYLRCVWCLKISEMAAKTLKSTIRNKRMKKCKRRTEWLNCCSRWVKKFGRWQERGKWLVWFLSLGNASTLGKLGNSETWSSQRVAFELSLFDQFSSLKVKKLAIKLRFRMCGFFDNCSLKHKSLKSFFFKFGIKSDSLVCISSLSWPVDIKKTMC